MSEESLDRFRDYTTSGAFNLALSKAQVAALSMIAETGEGAMGAHTYRALHHKGLILEVRGNSGCLEYRLTPAGVYALKLIRMADLVQGPDDPVAAEIEALTAQLGDVRGRLADVLDIASSMMARAEAAHRAIKKVKRFLRSGAPVPKPIVTLKDPCPDRSLNAMRATLDKAARDIEGGQG